MRIDSEQRNAAGAQTIFVHPSNRNSRLERALKQHRERLGRRRSEKHGIKGGKVTVKAMSKKSPRAHADQTTETETTADIFMPQLKE